MENKPLRQHYNKVRGTIHEDIKKTNQTQHPIIQYQNTHEKYTLEHHQISRIFSHQQNKTRQQTSTLPPLNIV